jgi:hypothetical protein
LHIHLNSVSAPERVSERSPVCRFDPVVEGLQARLLEITVPGGFERYFADVAELGARGLGPFDTERSRLPEAYGLVSNREWVADSSGASGFESCTVLNQVIWAGPEDFDPSGFHTPDRAD